ncbi:hypothetical protein [Rothia nasisuis]|uniref:hypothetical protein n=1 Tax=Rothia nasisuis TaxID=2109647 RepID=UPI001F481A14|nr:hypothetical protein [Rothia nasisuis]
MPAESSEPVERAAQGPALDHPTITRQESLALLLGSLLAAGSALLVTVLAARSLTPTAANEFVVFWGLLFGVYGVLTGIQQEVTRGVGAANYHRGAAVTGAGAPGARVLPVALLFGLGAALLLLVLGATEGPELLTTNTWEAFTLVALAAVLYSGQSAMMGAASGARRWYLLATVTGGDALARLLLATLVAFTLADLMLFYLAVTLPVLVWVILLVGKAGRATATERADVPASILAQKMGFAVVSSSANAVLVTGFPVVLQFASSEEELSNSAGLLAAVVFAITVTRSPIMIPLQSFQGVVISAFLKQQHRPLQALRTPLLALLGAGLLGGVLAYLLGPWLFSLIFGNKYDGLLAGTFLGALTFASAFMAILMMTGAATLATNRHRAYTAGWVTAAALATLLVFVPASLEIRALLALYLGPLAGALVHLGALYAGRRFTAQTPESVT